MINDILERLEQIETNKNNIIAALEKCGPQLPEETRIDEVPSYINRLGIFRGTREAYEIAYAAGNIPEGTIVIIDDAEQITKSDANVLISYTTMEELGAGRHHINCTPVVINAPVGYKFTKVNSVSTFSLNVEPTATISNNGLKLTLSISGWELQGVEVGQTATMRVSYSATCTKLCGYEIITDEPSAFLILPKTAATTATATERLITNGLGEVVKAIGVSVDEIVITAPDGCSFSEVLSITSTKLQPGLANVAPTGILSADGKTLTIDATADAAKEGTFKLLLDYVVKCKLDPAVAGTDTIEGQIARTQIGRDNITLALNKIGSLISKETLVEDITSYINELGIFRGTLKAYEEAYAAGKIPEGTIVVID